MGFGFIITFIFATFMTTYYLVKLSVSAVNSASASYYSEAAEQHREELKNKLKVHIGEEDALRIIYRSWEKEGKDKYHDHTKVVSENMADDFIYIFGDDYANKFFQIHKANCARGLEKNDETWCVALMLARKGKGLPRWHEYNIPYDLTTDDETNMRIVSRIEQLWWENGIEELFEVDCFKKKYEEGVKEGFSKRFLNLVNRGEYHGLMFAPRSLLWVNSKCHDYARVYKNEHDGLDYFAYRDLSKYNISTCQAWVVRK